jgi:hypothetical protein
MENGDEGYCALIINYTGSKSKKQFEMTNSNNQYINSKYLHRVKDYNYNLQLHEPNSQYSTS